jgi:hypothetical protein
LVFFYARRRSGRCAASNRRSLFDLCSPFLTFVRLMWPYLKWS